MTLDIDQTVQRRRLNVSAIAKYYSSIKSLTINKELSEMDKRTLQTEARIWEEQIWDQNDGEITPEYNVTIEQKLNLLKQEVETLMREYKQKTQPVAQSKESTDTTALRNTTNNSSQILNEAEFKQLLQCMRDDGVACTLTYLINMMRERVEYHWSQGITAEQMELCSRGEGVIQLMKHYKAFLESDGAPCIGYTSGLFILNAITKFVKTAKDTVEPVRIARLREEQQQRLALKAEYLKQSPQSSNISFMTNKPNKRKRQGEEIKLDPTVKKRKVSEPLSLSPECFSEPVDVIGLAGSPTHTNYDDELLLKVEVSNDDVDETDLVSFLDHEMN